ncbi:MAG: hypothetical protein QXJ62_06295 [Nitrososphaeria archaeon]
MKYEEFKKVVVEVLKDYPFGLTFREIKSLAGLDIGRIPGVWVIRLYDENLVRLEKRGGTVVWVLNREKR